MTAGARKHVVIAGGGVAALEAALALHDRAAGHVDVTLVAPSDDFVYRPLSVGEPFALGPARSVPLAKVARDLGIELRTGIVASVDPAAHKVRLGGDGLDYEDLDYDALLIAVGAQRVPAFEHVTTFRGQEDSESVHGLIQDVEGGYVSRVAFVVPSGVAWPLPIYELALMTAQRAYEMSLNDVELTIVTPEEAPLAVFGPEASTELARRLADAGIAVETSARAEIPGLGTVILHPHGRVLECDRVVALPHVAPIAIDGVPRDRDGFIPVDSHGRVRGAADLFAAGDGTWFPIKQGGLACQQADAAAEQIAADAGAEVDPQPFKPVLRGQLLTGERPVFMRRDVSGTAGDDSQASTHTLWWPPSKIAGKYLALYLGGQEEADLAAEVAPHVRRVALIADPLRQGHGIELLGFDPAAFKAEPRP